MLPHSIFLATACLYSLPWLNYCLGRSGLSNVVLAASPVFQLRERSIFKAIKGFLCLPSPILLGGLQDLPPLGTGEAGERHNNVGKTSGRAAETKGLEQPPTTVAAGKVVRLASPRPPPTFREARTTDRPYEAKTKPGSLISSQGVTPAMSGAVMWVRRGHVSWF